MFGGFCFTGSTLMDDYAQRLVHLNRLHPEDMLEELLAVIHGDGGHYTDEHGLAKSVADAEVKWYAAQKICALCGRTGHHAHECPWRTKLPDEHPA